MNDTAGLSRRDFLAGAAAVGLAAPGVSPASASRTPTRELTARAVVVGSGFGGSVAALRLARAGVRTLLLERGRSWNSVPKDNTFPRFFHPDQRVSWLEPAPVMPGSPPAVFPPYTGLVERVRGVGMSILCGTGVGGGSLHYSGITLQPSEELFTRVMPASVDFTEMAAKYYPTVKAKLRLSPIPSDILDHARYTSSRRFLADAALAGGNAVQVPQPMNWDVVRAELQGQLPPWSAHGDVLYGVNNGARYSTDKTYLAEARATGLLTIEPLHVVKEITTGRSRRYLLRCERIDTSGTVLEKVVINADTVFLNAGSANTSQLLVSARGTGNLPNLPKDVGKYWGNNGDRAFIRAELSSPTLPFQGGPACVAMLDWDAATKPGPATLFHSPVPVETETFSMFVVGMGIPDGHGEFVFDPASGGARLVWPPDADSGAEAAINAATVRIAASSGGVFVPTDAADPVATHPLGGAVIGPVCDPYGRVHDNVGLYVTDSALIPGSTACCNPSFTIAALAERCLDRIVAQDVGTII